METRDAEDSPTLKPAGSRTRRGGLFSGVRGKIYLLAALAVIHIGVSLYAIAPGYLLIDEACYHWMTKNLATRGTPLEIWNGYSEMPSVELSHRHLPVSAGRVVPRWPYLFPVLVLPFYKLFGLYGLFLVNALAFVGVLFLCFSSALKLFEDDNLAFFACLLLVFTTFTWEYSQAAWPHMTALLFIMAAFHLAVCAYRNHGERIALLQGFAAGLVAGFAAGVRLDSLLAFPAILFPFLFTRPWRPKEVVAVVLGSLPGLLILSWTNLVKFGVFTPLSYGPGTVPPRHFFVVVAGLVAVSWLITRTPCREFLTKRRALLLWVTGLLIVTILIWPQGRAFCKRTILHGFVSVVDVRALDRGTKLPSLERSSGGGMLYMGAHKKALLQSLPYLALLIVPLASIWRRDRYAAELCILFIAPLCYVGYYSYDPHEYGGLCLNFRYYLPALPFLSILCAYALYRMRREWGEPFRIPVIACIVILTGCGFFYLTWWTGLTPDSLEFPLLIIPQIMFLLLAFLLLAGGLIQTEGIRPIRGAAWVLLIVSMTWAGLVAFFYDYPIQHGARVADMDLDSTVFGRIPPDSILFTQPYIWPAAVEADRVRIAFPAMDKGKDLPKLVRFNFRQGRRVLAALPVSWWLRLLNGPLKGYRISKMGSVQGILLAEILPPAEKNNAGKPLPPSPRLPSPTVSPLHAR